MTDLSYSEELRAQLRRPPGRTRDRDVARLLAPWRRHRTGPDATPRGE